MSDVDIMVLPTLTVITNIFEKFVKFYDQEKIPIPPDVARFFFLRQSILSYLIFSNAFGYKKIIGPPELEKVLAELEKMYTEIFDEEMKIFYIRRSKPGHHVA